MPGFMRFITILYCLGLFYFLFGLLYVDFIRVMSAVSRLSALEAAASQLVGSDSEDDNRSSQYRVSRYVLFTTVYLLILHLNLVHAIT